MADEHLIPKVTDRGFRHMPEVWDDRRGRLRLFESSAADGGHIWLAVDEPDRPSVGVHLSIEQARQVAEQLQWLADNHYQSPSDPSVCEGATPPGTRGEG